MQYTTLGKTGLRVSVAGLGCGGASRLGKAYGKSTSDSIAIVQQAIDSGVNFIDTAAVYGTEEIIGQAIRNRRDQVVISSKARIIEDGADVDGNQLCSPQEYRRRLDSCLQRLKVDCIDVFHLHGVMAHQIEYCVDNLVPELQRAQDAGKIRFIGLTERFILDTKHEGLMTALHYDCWDVFMIGFNLLNFSARQQVLQLTQQQNIGTLCMFAVRKALSNDNALLEALRHAVEQGQLAAETITTSPLTFLMEWGESSSLQEAAYRFCRHEAGIDVVLTGTGNTTHLQENLAAINAVPLSSQARNRIEELFAGVDCISGN